MKAIKIPRFVRMNLDVDVRALQPGDSRRLLNGITIGPLGQEGWDGVVNNIVGDELVANANLQATSKVIGFLEDVAGNRCFYIVYHSGNNHTIYQYTSAGGTAKVIRTSVFGFAATDFVSADIIGDLLVLTNNVGEIRQINVAKALAGTHYVTPTRETISLIKKAPSLPLTLSEVAGSGRYSYSGYQFYSRWIYEDGQPSVWGSLSKIYSTRTPNTIQATILRITVPAETVPDTVIRKEFAFRLAKSNEFVVYRTENSGSYSATHDFIDESVGETIPDTDSFKWFESIAKASKAIKWMRNRLFIFNNLIGYDRPSTVDYSGVLSTVATVPNPLYPSTSSDLYTNSDDYYVFKSTSKFKMGILFTDWAGRHIGCVSAANMLVTIPDFNFTNWVGYRIGWDLTGKPNTNIPTWATHFQWVRTKSLTRSFFLQGLAPDVFYYKKDSDGAYVFSKTVIPDSEGVAIDLSSLTKNNIGYTLNPGDFIRLYTDSSVFVFDKKIEFQDGKFLFVKGSAASVTLTAAAPDIFYYEIYSPYSGALIETFYEIGEKYAITNPGTGGRAFGTLTGTLRGDCYMKERTAPGYDSGAYSATDPYSNKFNSFSSKTNHQAMNPSDDFFTDWIQDTGRAVQDTPALKEVRLTTNLRFGRPYNNAASTPEFNVFDPFDDQQLPIENGAGAGLAEAGEVLTAVHEAASTSVYIGQGFVNVTSGNNFLAKTDQVIGDFRKFLERSGSVNPATIIAKNGRVYWLDIRNGYVVRRSQDGLTPISLYGMRTEFSKYCQLYRDELSAIDQRIVAGWDPKYRCYVISFQNLGSDETIPSRTFHFHEDSNGWIATSFLYPEFFGQLNDRQLHFNAGALWRHTNNSNFNNWFGVQYYRTAEIEVGADSEEKIWTGIEVDIDSIFTPGTLSTLLKILSPTLWTDFSTCTPAPVFGSLTIQKDDWDSGSIAGRQALVIPPGGQINFSYQLRIDNVSGTEALVVAITHTLVGTSVTQVTTVIIPAGLVFLDVYVFNLTNTDVVSSSAIEIKIEKQTFSLGGIFTIGDGSDLGGGIGDGSDFDEFGIGEFGTTPVDVLITLPVGAVVYTTLSSNEDVILLYHKNGGALQTKINVRDFRLRASAWFSSFFRYLSDPNFGSETESKYKSTQKVRGQSAYIVVNAQNVEANPMKSITVFYEKSMLSYS